MTVSDTSDCVLITGATGFMGDALTRRLAKTSEVHIVARNVDGAHQQFSDLAVRVHPVSDVAAVVASVEPGAVYHLATHYERHDPDSDAAMRLANVDFGTEVLVAASAVGGCRVVIAGSQFQVAGPGGTPISSYARTKQELVDRAAMLTESSGLSWIQTMFYEVYGPNDHRDKLIPNMYRALSRAEEIQLPQPLPRLSFCHIDDAVDALIASREQLAVDPAAAGTSVFALVEPLVTPHDVVLAMAEALGTTPNISSDPYVMPAGAPLDPPIGPRPDGWQPSIGLRTGIASIVTSG